MLWALFKIPQGKSKQHILLGVLTTGSNTALWLKASTSGAAPLLSPAPPPPPQGRDHMSQISCLALTKAAIDAPFACSSRGHEQGRIMPESFVKKYPSPAQSGLGKGTEAIKGRGRKEEQVPLTSTSLTFSQLIFYTWKKGWERRRKHECRRRSRQKRKKIKGKVKQEKDVPSDAETLVCTPVPAQICPKA